MYFVFLIYFCSFKYLYCKRNTHLIWQITSNLNKKSNFKMKNFCFVCLSDSSEWRHLQQKETSNFMVYPVNKIKVILMMHKCRYKIMWIHLNFRFYCVVSFHSIQCSYNQILIINSFMEFWQWADKMRILNKISMDYFCYETI